MEKIKSSIISISFILMLIIAPSTSIIATEEDTILQNEDYTIEKLNSFISEETIIPTNPVPEPNTVIGPFVYLWIDADLSKEELVYFYYNQDENFITMYVEFLKEDVNSDSIIKWGTLLNSQNNPSIFDHKDPQNHYYYWIQIKNTMKKVVEYSNNRVKINTNGFNGLIYLSWTIQPLHDISAPRTPAIIGPFVAKPDDQYTYTFFSRSYSDLDLSYYIDWGDNSNTGWIGPYESCEAISLTHSWDSEGTYTIKAKAKDTFGIISGETTFELKISSKVSADIRQIIPQIITQAPQVIFSNSQSSSC